VFKSTPSLNISIPSIAIFDALCLFKFAGAKSCEISKFSSISKIFREIGLADELGSGMRNTYKYTQLYSGMEPIFEEGDIFKTIIPLKKIATEKVGGENVPRNVSQNVSRNVPQKSIEEMKEIMKEIIKKNNRVSRKYLAEILGVSEKTITRYIKEIPNLSYVGKGKNGYWKLDE